MIITIFIAFDGCSSADIFSWTAVKPRVVSQSKLYLSEQVMLIVVT